MNGNRTMALPTFRIPTLMMPHVSLAGEQVKPKVFTPEEKRRIFLNDIGITGIAGVEGMGKSLMMTRIGNTFHELGGDVVALEGYQLKDRSGKVVSKEIKAEEWVTFPEWLHDKLLLADEIEDHFNAQAWQSIIVRLFTGGYFGQRRKKHLGMVYTLQFFEELPKLMRKKTHWVIECKDAALYNPYRVADGKRELVGGEMTYTTIIDNFGKKPPFIHGFRRNGPMYHNKDMFDLYESETITDVMNQFTKIEVTRKVIKIDLNNDGVTTQEEVAQSQKLYEEASSSLAHAPTTMTASEFWDCIGLNRNNPAHQKIAAMVAKEEGYSKNWNGQYRKRTTPPPPVEPYKYDYHYQ